ncbi:MAG: hypothetical protein JXR46_16195 [Calditrichaceae bacterium]|nr:hypothetical protein [Calditrichaceae bacterium]MBN2710586.1 hypothetical protein [Calditrichaceae bacterium]
MDKKYLNIAIILDQENTCRNNTENFWGKNRNGFCDIALNGIEILIQGIGYFRDIDHLKDPDNLEDFNYAIRTLSFLHYNRVSYTFKATYNLILNGFYTEAAILLRSIVETFVRLKYINKSTNADLVYLAIAGNKGFNGKKFIIRYEEQFNTVARGLYKYYRILCDIAHGAMDSNILRSSVKNRNFIPDSGIIFNEKDSSFIINQFSAYLLGHIEFMLIIYPEIKNNSPEEFLEKMYSVLTYLWGFFKEMSNDQKASMFYNAIKKLVKN